MHDKQEPPYLAEMAERHEELIAIVEARRGFATPGLKNSEATIQAILLLAILREMRHVHEHLAHRHH